MNEINGKMTLDTEKLDEILKRCENDKEPAVIFGFTYILYSFVVRCLLDMGKRYKLRGSKVIHIGGWKKLEAEKVSSDKLITDCCNVFGVQEFDVVDFYGFTEQAGMIYPTCEAGLRHVPVWGEVLVRDPLTLEPVKTEREGLMQFITPIQTSYPGHSVLTEDVGYILNSDKCSCGRKGTAFKIVGRSEAATEVRGCGDILADKFS